MMMKALEGIWSRGRRHSLCLRIQPWNAHGVYAYNNPLVALSEFKPHFYDLLITDINLPDMNGFQFSQKILELDVNVKVCFITAGEANIDALEKYIQM